MTTTGGPEHSLADPASSNDDPVVLHDENALPGDDISVEPTPPGSHPRRRARALTVAIVVALLLAIGVAIAIAANGGSDANTKVLSESPGNPSPANPSVDKPAASIKPKPTEPAKPAASAPDTTAVAVAPFVPPVPPVSPDTPVSVAPQTTPVAPPPTMPPSMPPSVLKLTSQPQALSIKAGGKALLTVTVENPTDGTVTLGHPLSCPPTLKPVQGAPIGGAICVEMAQIMDPHQKIVAHYTIYATDTADESGAPLKAGQYIVNVENLYDVKVTVTAS